MLVRRAHSKINQATLPVRSTLSRPRWRERNVRAWQEYIYLSELATAYPTPHKYRYFWILWVDTNIIGP
jgi:hypothetical protein